MTLKEIYQEDILKLIQKYRDRNNKEMEDNKNCEEIVSFYKCYNEQLDDLELDIKEKIEKIIW